VDNKKKRSEDFFTKDEVESPNLYSNTRKNDEKKVPKCQYCGEEISGNVNMCPFCGSYINK
jgi:hypothetical protein